jgi:Site-specific DNA methylase
MALDFQIANYDFVIEMTEQAHNAQNGSEEGMQQTVRPDGSPCVDRGPSIICVQGSMIGRDDKNGPQGDGVNKDTCFTLNTIDRHAVAVAKTYDGRGDGNGTTVGTIVGDHESRVNDNMNLVVIKTAQTGSNGSNYTDDGIAYTLNGANDQAVISIDRAAFNQGGNALYDPSFQEDVAQTLVAKGPSAVAIDCRNRRTTPMSATLQAKAGGGYGLNYINPIMTYVAQRYGDYKESETSHTLDASHDINTKVLIYQSFIVRRLTPLECTRLQGYPDHWVDIPGASDTAKYTALGNSIALPPWRYVLGRLCNQIGRRATMGSLFDGIGGFPLIWQEINGKGSALWASEINPFCIRVTEARFEEDAK